MLKHNDQLVSKPRNGLFLFLRGTPFSINRRILDHLYQDLKEKKITAMLLIEISRDMRKALYPDESELQKVKACERCSKLIPVKKFLTHICK